MRSPEALGPAMCGARSYRHSLGRGEPIVSNAIVHLGAGRCRLSSVRDVEIRWTELDGKSIAYEVFGAGPIDLLLGQSWCPIDLLWELPQLASFLDTLAGMARVIVLTSSAPVRLTTLLIG